MSCTTVELETVAAGRRRHALELETMRQKYEDLMNRAQDLAKKNELLKRELERREVGETLRRGKEREMEDKEIEKSYTSAVGDANPVDTAKWEHEIEVRPLVKQVEAQKEPNPTKSDNDATGNTLEEQTGKNMEKNTEAFFRDDEEFDNIPERRSSDDEHEEKAYEKRCPYWNSESGKDASDKGKGPHHEDKSREKIAQKILIRRKRRNNVNANDGFLLSMDSTPHFVPVTEREIILKGKECGSVVLIGISVCPRNCMLLGVYMAVWYRMVKLVS